MTGGRTYVQMRYRCHAPNDINATDRHSVGKPRKIPITINIVVDILSSPWSRLINNTKPVITIMANNVTDNKNPIHGRQTAIINQ